MSLLYEGFLVAANADTVRRHLESTSPLPLHFHVVELRANLTGLLRIANRSTPFEVDLVVAAARLFSVEVAPCLAVFYDDRIGLRHSMLLVSGLEQSHFSEADELWVPLLASGEPDLEAPRLHASELLEGSDREYETVSNAIDLGIVALDPLTDLTSMELGDTFVEVDF